MWAHHGGGVFWASGVEATDPYFGGEGPPRTGCTGCGGCLLGCRVGAKNSLDKNYLYLAEKRGLRIEALSEVTWVSTHAAGGYELTVKTGESLWRRPEHKVRAQQIIFAGGVMGTVPLLLRLRASLKGLPYLSQALGCSVRTNSEALIGMVAPKAADLSKGLAISSILHTDAHSSLEPVRYPSGSGFFRLLSLPHVPGHKLPERLARLVSLVMRHPLQLLRALTVRDFGRQSLVLLYMRSLEGSLSLRLGRSAHTAFTQGPNTFMEGGAAPSAYIPEATDLAHRMAQKLGGYPMTIASETLLNIPTTAHLLGGCTMGRDAQSGVIDAQHRVFNYPGLYVVDGSAVSANPGVNPSLTICALAERAMLHIPAKVFTDS